MNESVMVGSEERGIYTSSEKHPLRSTLGVPTQISELLTLTRNTVQRRVEDTVGTTLSELPTYVGTSDEGLSQMDSRQRVRTPDTMSGLPTVGTLDLRRDFRCYPTRKNILSVRAVLG
jgi:hypothetical protein